MGNMNICGALCTHPSGVFSWEKLPSDRRSNIGAHIEQEGFTELFLFSIIKYGKNDKELQTSIQGMSLSDFWGLYKEKKRKL